MHICSPNLLTPLLLTLSLSQPLLQTRATLSALLLTQLPKWTHQLLLALLLMLLQMLLTMAMLTPPAAVIAPNVTMIPAPLVQHAGLVTV